MIFQTHQLSWSHDNYRRLKPFWSKKFISMPKKNASFKKTRDLKLRRITLFSVEWRDLEIYASNNSLIFLPSPKNLPAPALTKPHLKIFTRTNTAPAPANRTRTKTAPAPRRLQNPSKMSDFFYVDPFKINDRWHIPSKKFRILHQKKSHSKVTQK